MSLFPTLSFDSLDEVVFEGRNQSYGAYQLRHAYQRHLLSAGGITLLLCAFLALSWATWQQLRPAAPPVVAFKHEVEPILPPINVVIEKPKLAVITPPATRPVATHPVPVVPTQVAKDEVPQPHPTPLIPSEIVDDQVGLATSTSSVGLPATSETINDGGGKDANATTPVATNEPFTVVEKMPEFMGGQAALLRYLRSHLRYPGAALAAGVGGRVFLSFVVQADGTISDVTVLKGLGYGLDDEAQRVVRQMPHWTPGYQSQHPVPVRFTLPITFQYQ